MAGLSQDLRYQMTPQGCADSGREPGSMCQCWVAQLPQGRRAVSFVHVVFAY